MKPRARPRHLEFKSQCALIQWLSYEHRKYPELAYLYAIPNDIRTTPQRAARAKAMGMKSGVPDLCLPVPRGPWHGMYIEMKSLDGQPSPAQRDFLTFLGNVGYATCVCRSAPEARDNILRYLNLKPTHQPQEPIHETPAIPEHPDAAALDQSARGEAR